MAIKASVSLIKLSNREGEMVGKVYGGLKLQIRPLWEVERVWRGNELVVDGGEDRRPEEEEGLQQRLGWSQACVTGRGGGLARESGQLGWVAGYAQQEHGRS